LILGYNYRMTDLQAALGIEQLKKLEDFTAKRIHNAELLNQLLKIKGLTTPYKTNNVRHVYHQYVVRIEDDFAASRETLMEYLQAKGVGSAVHYPKAVYEHPLYQRLGYGNVRCPVSEELSRRVMSLPVHPSLSRDDIEYVAETVNNFEA
jgi:perosamine synthetase